MKSIKFMVIILMIITMLCSCGTISNETSDTSLPNITTGTAKITTVTVEIPTESNEKTSAEKLIDEAKRFYSEEFGSGDSSKLYFYDFDLDGTPEMFFVNYELIEVLLICKLINSKPEFKFMGRLPNNSRFLMDGLLFLV